MLCWRPLFFELTFSCIPEKLMLSDKADFAQTKGFKVFPGIKQGNPLIKSQYPADSRVFPRKQSGYPCRMPSSDSSLPSVSTVAHRDRPCAGFKARLGKMYHGAGISALEPMCNRGISLQIRRYYQGQNVCWLKSGWRKSHPTKVHRPAKPSE